MMNKCSCAVTHLMVNTSFCFLKVTKNYSCKLGSVDRYSKEKLETIDCQIKQINTDCSPLIAIISSINKIKIKDQKCRYIKINLHAGT